MNLKLEIWRQKNHNEKGSFYNYTLDDVSPDISFLEMLDILNEQLTLEKEEPVAFDHDCREGICGACGVMINGQAHGPNRGTTTCQLHMRSFKSGDTIVIEPFRSSSFPIVRDLVVDRSAFDRISRSGGYISVNTGAASEANLIPVSQKKADEAFLAAECIGCGACVATCKNSSAMLFTAAKVSHLSLLPQGQPGAYERPLNMVKAMDNEGFGNCSNTGACEIECPKQISITNIARLNRLFLKSSVMNEF